MVRASRRLGAKASASPTCASVSRCFSPSVRRCGSTTPSRGPTCASRCLLVNCLRMEKFRTLIVDDEPAARDGTRALLDQDAEIDVIGECDNGADAAAVIIDQAPDIVVLDIEMPDRDG